jgi:hypothetical protein
MKRIANIGMIVGEDEAMTREEMDVAEFEEWFDTQDFRLMEKPDHEITFLASRRLLREREAKTIEVIKKIVKDVTKELMNDKEDRDG